MVFRPESTPEDIQIILFGSINFEELNSFLKELSSKA